MINWKKYAFTLIELLVVIIIVTILTIWISSLYSKNMWDRQRLNIQTNLLITILDTTKNNALVWKWIWRNLDVPEYYNLEIKKNKDWNQWSLKTSYFLTWITNYPDLSIENYDIKNIFCFNLDWTIITESESITIKYEWNNISATWCSSESQKLVEVIVWFKSFFSKVKINTITWVIEDIKYQAQ